MCIAVSYHSGDNKNYRRLGWNTSLSGTVRNALPHLQGMTCLMTVTSDLLMYVLFYDTVTSFDFIVG